MTVSRGAPYWLWIGGAWKNLVAVAPGAALAQERPTTEFVSLGNALYRQSAARARRTWGLSFEWEDAEASRWLDDAASNVGEIVWFHDVALAQAQMLRARETQGASATLVSVDGRNMRAFNAGEGFQSMLRAGEAYHLSYTTTHTAGATIGTFDIGAGPVDIVAPSGAGARRGSVSFIPSTDADLSVVWTVAAKTTAARLTEGSVDELGFLPSRGHTPCRVAVSDGSATFKMSWSDQLALADSAYVVTELG